MNIGEGINGANCDENVKILKTEKGRPLIARQGYLYTFHKKIKIGEVWRCKNRSICSSTLSTTKFNNDIKILKETSHKCSPNTSAVTLIALKNACKYQAVSNIAPVPRLYENIIKDQMDAGFNLIGAVPNYKSVKTSMYNERNKNLNVSKTHFKTRGSVVIPAVYSKDFLLFDIGIGTNERMIAFTTNKAKQLIPKLNVFICDGTFRSCYRLFYQLYTIHGDIGSSETFTNIVPLIYVLMPNKEQVTYERMFFLLRQYIPGWAPSRFIVDFEIATINALSNVFPNIMIQGCNFHFKQALYKKAADIGLTKDYDGRHHISMCAALAYLKEDDAEDGWLTIMETASTNQQNTEFNDYFVSTWLDNKKFKGIWNCYRARHRTINSAESWHKRFNNNMATRKPDLLQFFDVLKREGQYFDYRIQQSETGIIINNRKRRVIQTDKEISSIVDDYENKKIGMLETIRKLSTCTCFREL